MEPLQVTYYSNDPEKPIRPLVLEKKNLLKQLQEHIGGYVERVPLYGTDPAMSLIVDEEGLLKNLEFNFTAFNETGIQCVGPAILMKTSDLD